MRDKPIPEVFEPSTYNAKQLTEVRAELARLEAMTAYEVAAAADAEYAERLANHKKYEAEQEAADLRIQEMLNKVRAWTPPTAEHVRFKEFMVEQLTMSLHGDYRSPTPRNWSPASGRSSGSRSSTTTSATTPLSRPRKRSARVGATRGSRSYANRCWTGKRKEPACSGEQAGQVPG